MSEWREWKTISGVSKSKKMEEVMPKKDQIIKKKQATNRRLGSLPNFD